MIVWKIIYNVLILPLMVTLLHIVAIFNKKIRRGIIGRYKSLRILREFFNDRTRDIPVYWFHAASHGEYEQIRPVIKGLKEILPSSTMVVSFFSPSGYGNVNDQNIDCKIYLPIDFPWIINRALSIVKPKKIIFAAYDVWPNLIWQAKRNGIHTTIFSARFAIGTRKLYPIIRSFYQNVYTRFSSIYTITEEDHSCLQKILVDKKPPRVRVLGNPRYDQVKEYADQFSKVRTESVLTREQRLIIGSVWPEDENVIFEPIIKLLTEFENLSVLWVPHEPSGKYISHSVEAFESRGLSTSTYVSCDGNISNGSRVIVVDIVGTLATLYWSGQLAYVGGGFSTGVHNVMEPAIARLPVLFGPKYKNSSEAEQMMSSNGGFSIEDSETAYRIFHRLLSDRQYFLKTSISATNVIHRNLGSATRVVRAIIHD